MNPYSSPISSPEPRPPRAFARKILAFLLWGLAAVPILFVVYRSQQNGAAVFFAAMSVQTIAIFAVFVLGVFGLLASSLVIFGFASWYGSRRLAAIGAICLAAWLVTIASVVLLTVLGVG